ncbi:MAG TPA: cupin domain-containing protein, partial [Ktedonobacteraceae bacterium]|nr:cupin domain-containing protein [Ktedonobacteraceae bacterium]
MNKNRELQEREEANAEPGSMIVFDLRALTQFQDERPYVQILSDINTARVVLFAFRKGQQLKKHSTSSQLLVQVLRGKVLFSTASSSVEMQAGMLVQLETNVEHTVIAQTDAVMLLTMTPSPTYHSM